MFNYYVIDTILIGSYDIECSVKRFTIYGIKELAQVKLVSFVPFLTVHLTDKSLYGLAG